MYINIPIQCSQSSMIFTIIELGALYVDFVAMHILALKKEELAWAVQINNFGLLVI